MSSWQQVWWENGNMWVEGVKKQDPEPWKAAIRRELGRFVAEARGYVWSTAGQKPKFYPEFVRGTEKPR